MRIVEWKNYLGWGFKIARCNKHCKKVIVEQVFLEEKELHSGVCKLCGNKIMKCRGKDVHYYNWEEAKVGSVYFNGEFVLECLKINREWHMKKFRIGFVAGTTITWLGVYCIWDQMEEIARRLDR